MPNRANNLAVEERARELFSDHLNVIQRRTDRLFALLMIVQWMAAIIIALIVSPRTWAGSTSRIHVHVWLALLLGGLINAGPMLFVWRRPGAPITRHVIACAQMLWSALLIHLTGGRIETHFHVFGSLAFLAFYRDWRVFIPATIVVGADHLLRGIFWPQSVYGVLTTTPWRSLEHVVWVLFEDIVLIRACRQGIAEMWDIATQRASLEKSNECVAFANETIKQSEERTRKIIETSLDAVVTIDDTGVITGWNGQAEAIFGWCPDEAVGQPLVSTIIPPAYRDAHQKGMGHFLDTGAGPVLNKRIEITALRRDGREFPIELSVTPIAIGNTYSFSAFVRDITERKCAEETRARLATIVENSEDAIFSMSMDGMIQTWNAGAERLYGYTVEEAIGQPVHMLIPPERVEEEHEIVVWVQQGKRVEPFETVRVAKDGRQIDVSISVSPISDLSGNIIGAAKTARDITKRKRAEAGLRDSAAAVAFANESLRAANEELRKKNAELDEFTFIASHDLQEPLRKITSFGELLPKDLGGALPEAAGKDLGFITEAAKRMRTLVQDLLALSRAGRAAITRERVSLAECADQALLDVGEQIKRTGADITRDELPDVLGDPTMLTQLYQNLISNALKFAAHDRPPEIHLSCKREDEHWLLGVSDNGIGIKADYHEQIFAPFKRLHGRDKYEGTGIGLAICRKAVERHGGRIWVQSEPGRGAQFKFTLNCDQESLAWLNEEPSPRSSSLPRMTLAIKS